MENQRLIMIKDIEIPKVENVHIVAIYEWNEEFTSQQWVVYLINNRSDTISMAMVMSRGKSDDRRTSTLRHSLGDLEPQTSHKVELITEDVLGFTNEYLITFFAENKLYERRFVFNPNAISEENTTDVPVIDVKAVKAE